MSFLNPRSSESAVCSTRYEGSALASFLCLLPGNCCCGRGSGYELGFKLGPEGGSSNPSFSNLSGVGAMGDLHIIPCWPGAGHLGAAEAGLEPRVWDGLQRGAGGACRGNDLLPLLQVLEDCVLPAAIPFLSGVWTGTA